MIDFATKRVLTFDCYGTLIDWEARIVATLQSILSAHGMRADAEYLLALYSKLEPAVEQGPYLPYRELLTAVLRGFGERLGFSPSEPEQTRLAGSVGNWPPFTDTPVALAALKRRFKLPSSRTSMMTSLLSRIRNSVSSLTGSSPPSKSAVTSHP